MQKFHAFVGVFLLLHFCVMNAQNTINLGEVSVVASRISNNAEGYQVSLKGNKYVKGKNSEETLKLLDRQLSGTLINRKDITPVQKIGLTVLWKFSGGKNVRVNTLNGMQDYHEIKDN